MVVLRACMSFQERRCRVVAPTSLGPQRSRLARHTGVGSLTDNQTRGSDLAIAGFAVIFKTDDCRGISARPVSHAGADRALLRDRPVRWRLAQNSPIADESSSVPPVCCGYVEIKEALPGILAVSAGHDRGDLRRVTLARGGRRARHSAPPGRSDAGEQATVAPRLPQRARLSQLLLVGAPADR